VYLFESKFDSILRHLNALLEKYPDYHLSVCGHSLGGSLALLAAAKLAAIPDIPSPVHCLAFGPLMVGDLRLQQAFESLEDTKRIRCVSVVNDGDLIPFFPFLSFRNGRFYRHVGNRIRLFRPKNKKTPKLSRPPQSQTRVERWVKDGPNVVRHGFHMAGTFFFRRKFWVNHSVETTMENLLCASEDLKKMSWETLYSIGTT
jgi:pimeloyl-ACP methyl ester carboxylesterase